MFSGKTSPPTAAIIPSTNPIGSRRRKANLVPAHLTNFQLENQQQTAAPIKRRRKATHTLHLNNLNVLNNGGINGFSNNTNETSSSETNFSSLVAKIDATTNSNNTQGVSTLLNESDSSSNWQQEIMEVSFF